MNQGRRLAANHHLAQRRIGLLARVALAGDFARAQHGAMRAQRADLVQFMADVQIGWLTFTPAIARIKLPDELKKYDCFVHAFQGSLDKTLVEATLSAIPVATVNKEYLKIFGKWNYSNSNNQPFLTSELRFILSSGANAISKEVDRRYEIARSNHDIEGWISRLVNVLDQN